MPCDRDPNDYHDWHYAPDDEPGEYQDNEEYTSPAYIGDGSGNYVNKYWECKLCCAGCEMIYCLWEKNRITPLNYTTDNGETWTTTKPICNPGIIKEVIE